MHYIGHRISYELLQNATKIEGEHYGVTDGGAPQGGFVFFCFFQYTRVVSCGLLPDVVLINLRSTEQED